MDLVLIIGLALKISIFLLVFGYGLTTTFTNAFYLFRNPWKLFRTLLAMNVLLPAVVILLLLLFQPEPLVRVTLIALAVSPVPPLFPVKPLQAGTREEYVTGLLVAASLCSIIFIPLNLKLLEIITSKPVILSTSLLFKTVLLTLILPLAAGIFIRYFAPDFARKTSSFIIRLAQILLILAVLPLLIKLFPAILALIGNGTVLLMLGFVVSGIIIGHLLGGPDTKDRYILAVATATRHPGIALVVAGANLPDEKLVPAAVVLYLLVGALVTLPYLKFIKQREHTELPK